jgi:transposase
MVIDCPLNSVWLQAYVDEVLVPALTPGGVVTMDNLSSHKRPGVRAAIVAASPTLLYLPPDSPDFHPIENAFAKLEALLQGRRTHNRASMDSHRRTPRRLHAEPLRKHVRRRRL